LAKLSKPLLIEYRFELGARRRSASVRLGFPRPSAKHKGAWECFFQLYGVKDSSINRATGVDGLQALTIAASAIRKSLSRLKVVESAAGPYEFTFPKTLPMS